MRELRPRIQLASKPELAYQKDARQESDGSTRNYGPGPKAKDPYLERERKWKREGKIDILKSLEVNDCKQPRKEEADIQRVHIR